MTFFNFDSSLIASIVVYVLLAYSVQVPLRAGVFALSGIGCFAIGGYTTAILTIEGAPLVLALVAGVLLSAGVSLLLALVLVRLNSLYLAMATVAFVVIIGVIAANAGDLTGGAIGLFAVPVSLGLWPVEILVVVVSLLLVALERYVSGRSILVAREDEELAHSLGINIASQRRMVFVVSGMLGGLAGGCHVLTVASIAPETAGFSMIILVLTMVILGGFGTWAGAALGAAILTWLPLELASVGHWWPVIYGLVLTGMAVYAPAGLAGLLSRLFRGIRRTLLRRSNAPRTREVSVGGDS